MPEREKRPVFVFLDENVPDAAEIVQERFRDSEGLKVMVFSFPDMLTDGPTLDAQVANNIRKRIYWKKYGIRKFLNKSPKPIFVIITLDLNFIEDVGNDLNYLGKKYHSFQFLSSKIKLLKNSIRFEENLPTELFVCRVFHEGNDKKKVLTEKVIQTLTDFLAAFD